LGAYRINKVPDSHPLALQIKEAERIGSTMTTIRLGCLGRSSVRSLVAEALGMEGDEGRVERLADVVREFLHPIPVDLRSFRRDFIPHTLCSVQTRADKKTEGNPFFVIFFLRLLFNDKLLLRYNLAVAG